MACWMALLGIVHTIDASIAHSRYFGKAGIKQLYTQDYLGQTGVVVSDC